MSLLKIGIARDIPEKHLIPAFQAALDGGFSYLEVTMNTPGACKQIKEASREFTGKATIGAGTVTTLHQLEKALEAGARFIVSPIVCKDIITLCNDNAIPVFPGALTPTEILYAWEAGATMVKVFPVGLLGGAAYIKELKGPFKEIKLLACSGVSPQNLPDYIAAGTDGIGIGNRLFNKQWIEKMEYQNIRKIASQYKG